LTGTVPILGNNIGGALTALTAVRGFYAADSEVLLRLDASIVAITCEDDEMTLTWIDEAAVEEFSLLFDVAWSTFGAGADMTSHEIGLRQ
jgi:hypothetical protein